MIRTFIQMTSMILTLEASYFLLKVNFGMSPKDIAELSSTCWDYNRSALKSLSEQCANSRVGLALLLLAFFLQLWLLRWKDFGIDWYGILISIIFCIIVFVIAKICSRFLSHKWVDQSVELKKNHKR
jgi:hypothetical protein